MKNAISELEILKENYEGYVELDDVNQKILPGKVNSDFYNFVLQAYYYLDSIRIFKKFGKLFYNLFIKVC